MALYALNTFDLANNDLYRQYSCRSVGTVDKHGGRVVALGRLSGVQQSEPGVEPRQAMGLVEWPSQESFQSFLEDPEHADLHPLREDGTLNCLWWIYEDWRICGRYCGPLTNRTLESHQRKDVE